jgi:hypothetical protein
VKADSRLPFDVRDALERVWFGVGVEYIDRCVFYSHSETLSGEAWAAHKTIMERKCAETGKPGVVVRARDLVTIAGGWR